MKCVKCGAVCADSKTCVGCGSDIAKMKNDTSYLALSLIQSRPFMSLRSSASIAMTVYVICCILSLFTGQLRPALSLILTSLGIYSFAGTFRRDQEYRLSRAPGHLFTASAVISALTFALAAAVCIGICIGGRESIDFILSAYKDISGIDMVDEFISLASQVGMNVTADMFYMSLYMICVVGMFICGGGLLISGVEFIFLTSFKSSVTSNKVELNLTGPFVVSLLIKAIGSLVAVLFSASFTDAALYAASGYMYLCAYRCARSVHELYK